MGQQLTEIRGERFGRLVVVQRSAVDPEQWICRCDCGQEAHVLGSNLRFGLTKSCGCYARDCASGVARVSRECVACGSPFEARVTSRPQRRCPNCYSPRLRNQIAGRPPTTTELFNRDGGICKLCKRPVNPRLRVPHPMAATVDHIIPVIHGGTHDHSNTQLAHFRCNCRKGSKLGGVCA